MKAHWFWAPAVVLDTETTGRDPEKARIVELAYGRISDASGLEPGEQTYINPGCPIPDEASNVHGIFDDLVADSPSFYNVLPMLNRALAVDTRRGVAPVLVGYAIDYDLTVLRQELTRVPADVTHANVSRRLNTLAESAIDLLIWMRWEYRDMAGRSLSHVCREFSLPVDRAHRAMSDVYSTGHLAMFFYREVWAPREWDLGDVLKLQAQFRTCLEAEYDKFGAYIYCDRRPPYRLLWGRGKYIGQPLAQPGGDYIRSMLTNENVKLTPAAREELEKLTRVVM